MNRLMVAAACMVAFGLGGQSHEAHAGDWQVCNHTPDPIEVAIGYAVQGGHLQSEGWFKIAACGGCAVVLLPADTVDRSQAYLYAQVSKGDIPLVEGSEPICVNNKPFKIRRTENCEGRNFKTKQAKSIAINLNKDFTTTITGERKCNQ